MSFMKHDKHIYVVYLIRKQNNSTTANEIQH